MFSLESFYSILYSNILEPANFCDYYLHPFGSTSPDNLASFSQSASNYTINQHLCFFYDQEPLIKTNIDKFDFFTRPINCNLLASSEKSEFRDSFTRNEKNNFLNWYYFFHGFAALDWYRNSKYYNSTGDSFSKIFMSLNRLCLEDRNYRLHLISLLKNKNLLNHGNVSLHIADDHSWKKDLASPNNKMSRKSSAIVYNSLKSLSGPIVCDKEHVVGWDSANYDYSSFKFNKSSLWHIVSETVFYYDKLHLTEKIFKPIVHKRPFILVGATNNLKYLKDYGFQSFDKWIDESYDNIADHDERIDAIVGQIERLTSLTLDKQIKMHNEMKEVLDYNFNHFFGKFKYIISKELIDNFKACITAYNNAQGFEDNKVNISHCNFNNLMSI